MQFSQNAGDFWINYVLTLTSNKLAKFKTELVSEFFKGKTMVFLLLLFTMLLFTDVGCQYGKTPVPVNSLIRIEKVYL